MMPGATLKRAIAAIDGVSANDCEIAARSLSSGGASRRAAIPSR